MVKFRFKAVHWSSHLNYFSFCQVDAFYIIPYAIQYLWGFTRQTVKGSTMPYIAYFKARLLDSRWLTGDQNISPNFYINQKIAVQLCKCWNKTFYNYADSMSTGHVRYRSITVSELRCFIVLKNWCFLWGEKYVKTNLGS